MVPKIVYGDLYRYNGKSGFWNLLKTVVRKIDFRWLFLYRLYQSKRFRFFSWLFLRHCSIRTGIQIGWHSTIGEGLLLVHCGSVVVNNEAVIGRNCTLYHGVTIGMEFRGKRRGNPVIGNEVWIGSNACVVGNITIGNDVLIAPLTYVNFDVPSHSIVLGNPGRIIPKEKATEGYIQNILV